MDLSFCKEKDKTILKQVINCDNVMNSLTIFENFKTRKHFYEKTQKWYFSLIDIIAVLTNQKDYQMARKYWNKLKERLKNEGSEVSSWKRWCASLSEV